MKQSTLGIIASIAIFMSACVGPTAHRDTYATGAIKAEGPVSRGFQQGPWKYYYEDGRVRAEGEWKKDIQEGSWRWYFPDGTVKQEGFYQDGLRSGWWTYYHANGQVKAQGMYQRDRQDGLWRYFSEAGSALTLGVFDRGARALQWQIPDDRDDDRENDASTRGLYLAGAQVGSWSLSSAQQPVEHGLPSGWVQVGDQDDVWAARDTKGALLVRKEISPKSQLVAYGQAGEHLVAQYEQATGKVAASGRVVAGQPHGEWLFALPTSAVYWKADFQNGQLRSVTQPQVGVQEVYAAVPDGSIDDPGSSKRASPRAAIQQMAADLARAVSDLDQWVATAQPTPVKAKQAVPAPTPRLHEMDLSPVVTAPGGMPMREQKSVAMWTQVYEGKAKPPAYADYGPSGASFRQRKDLIGQPLPVTAFLDGQGSVTDLKQLRGDGTLLLVVMRGFAGNVCPYCVAQTRALLNRKREFEQAGCKIAICYPGSAASVPQFIQAVGLSSVEAVPVTVLLDVDLAFVRAIDIERELAKPTTLLIDQANVVQYAYVGKDLADRPAIDDIYKTVKSLGPSQ